PSTDATILEFPTGMSTGAGETTLTRGGSGSRGRSSARPPPASARERARRSGTAENRETVLTRFLGPGRRSGRERVDRPSTLPPAAGRSPARRRRGRVERATSSRRQKPSGHQPAFYRRLPGGPPAERRPGAPPRPPHAPPRLSSRRAGR